VSNKTKGNAFAWTASQAFPGFLNFVLPAPPFPSLPDTLTRSGFHSTKIQILNSLAKAWGVSLQVAALAVYSLYYFPYQFLEYRNRAIDRLGYAMYPVYVALLPLDVPVYAYEAAGLAGDMALNEVIRKTVPGKSANQLNDEGKFTGLFPAVIGGILFGDPDKPLVWAPGWHCDNDGQRKGCGDDESRDPGRVDFHFLWWDHFVVDPKYGD
jgi:hypothetical protein